MAKTPAVNLSHDELAALDLIILSALQRGRSLDEKMSFIDAIVDAVGDVAHQVADATNEAVNFVADHAQEVIDVAAHVVEVTAHVAEAAGEARALEDHAVAAIKNVISTTAKTPPVTLEQLIEIRRRAVSGAKRPGLGGGAKRPKPRGGGKSAR